jgi:NAD(P)H-dependent FMN reductase
MEKLHIGIIIGSTRAGRFSEYPAQWLAELGLNRPDLMCTILDLREYDLPFLTDAINPSKKNGVYEDASVTRFAETVRACDGYIVVTPEYNHGYPAVLKNAIDHIKGEWGRKPVAFVSYGTLGGARAVEQLRLVYIDMGTVPLKHAVHIVAPWELRDETGVLKAGTLDMYEKAATTMFDDLSWWAKTLKAGRVT